MGIFLIILIFIGIPLFVNHMATKNDEKEKNKIKIAKENQQRFKEENNIPEDASVLEIITENKKISTSVLTNDNIFNIYGMDIEKIQMPINNIKYFERKGDFKTEIITEGGGINFLRAIGVGIAGAIIGYMIGDFYDAINLNIFSSGVSSGLAALFFILGILIGGKRKVKTINKEIDNRKTYLYYLDNNLIFSSSAYDIFLKLLPQKELSYIQNNKILNSEQENNIYDDIKKLAELKEKGILTEEEFNSKKQLLLDKIQ